MYHKTLIWIFLASSAISFYSCNKDHSQNVSNREKISLNKGWKFMKYDSLKHSDSLIYDVRPIIGEFNDAKEADTEPTDMIKTESTQTVLKHYILPTANPFIKDKAKHHTRPEGNPGSDFPFVQYDFDDGKWENIDLPHDWAIEGPFMEGWDAEVGGGMGRLPSHGVAWYRKKLEFLPSDKGKSIFLDVDGAMSYAMVWLNGHLIGGWPYGYNSWRVDLTPYLNFKGENLLAIRLDNPNHSSRWYPGGGIYRNVWLTKTNKIHVAHWGTRVSCDQVSETSAIVNFSLNIDNDSNLPQDLLVSTEIYELNKSYEAKNEAIAQITQVKTSIQPGEQIKMDGSTVVENPKLWGPPPSQTPNLYKAVTTLLNLQNEVIDNYETTFGIRSIDFDPDRGLFVNGEAIEIKGVNQHHDLGALGAAFNTRAAERQLEILRELGCNAIRMAHNPPAPELLELTDKMGFLVIDEVYDCWERKKTPHDFHLIFPDWYEADLRSFIRRDKNHPSVILWSFGNEVGEQYTDTKGSDLGKKLRDIVLDEDPTRLSTASMNYAKPPMPFPGCMDVISLNYQGEGIRNAPGYAHLQGINTHPLYPSFHISHPDKCIISSETAAAFSSRGTYLFPVTDAISSPLSEGKGGDGTKAYVSAYELYTANFGSSADKVFASQDRHPYVAGEFVWSGFDYLGEPTPYYTARSSYFGIIDLAGFPKDRYYLYQSRWRPDHPMVHILPHWNWPAREGLITPVHVFTSGDEVELFLNGTSLGRKKKAEFEYRLRWDDIKFEPGTLKAVAYNNGKKWAEQIIKTTGKAAKLLVEADRTEIKADGTDLSFITVKVHDEQDQFVANANNEIEFTIEGPGKIVATDNGDPTDFTSFYSKSRKAFNGLLLGIVCGKKDEKGVIKIKVSSPELQGSTIEILSN